MLLSANQLAPGISDALQVIGCVPLTLTWKDPEFGVTVPPAASENCWVVGERLIDVFCEITSVTGTVIEPAAEVTVTELLLYPTGRPAGFTDTVTGTPGPDAIEPGVPDTLTHPSAGVIEEIARFPPPEFWTVRGKLLDTGFAVVEVNASRVVETLNWAGGALTFSVRLMLCVCPAQVLVDAQVTTSAVVYGDPAGSCERAELVSVN